ncbi:MAG: hypothetical protein AAFY11_07225 [Cyanobacteria bacterium J06641_5]
MNAPIRFVVLACLGAPALVFLLSNRQPLSVVFFGRSLPALPMAVWVLIFGVAGVLSGLIFQVLPRLGSGIRTERSASSGKSQRPERRERPEIADDRAGWATASPPDWEAPPPPDAAVADEWNIDEPPTPQEAVDPERLRRPRPERARTRPANPAPAPDDSGLDPFDDFDFPDAADTGGSNEPGVVDTPFRVIDPPRQPDDDNSNEPRQS